jgi:hypothetical protein
MEVENDFEVIFENGICSLKGHLVDSTDLEFMKETFSKSHEVSLGGLSSVSWLGLRRLYDCLFRLSNPIQFADIPPHIYRILLLLPGFGKKIGIKSFQVEVFDSSLKLKKTSMTLEKLSEIGKEQGCFAKLSDGQKISGSLHHLCRPYFNDYKMPKKNYVAKWCIENEGLCTFFYEYTCFTRLILEICSLAQDSTSLLIEESLQSICSRISNLEFCVKSINPNFSDYKSRSLMSMLPHIHEVSKSVVMGINLSSTTFESVVQTFEALFIRERLVESEIYDQMEFFITFTDQLVPIARNLEDVGVELGENILKYGDFYALQKSFDDFNGTNLSEKKIVSIRRKLKKDLYTNLTWNETLSEVRNEFKVIETELNKCIVALQGFDLVRQVLEHRIIEINIFKNLLNHVKNKRISWEELKEETLIQIVDRLVTDQEKYNYYFFFPDSTIQTNESKIMSGEPFFF